MPIKRLVQLFAVQGLAVIGPFIILPIIARSASAAEWTSFVAGQSFGLFLAVVVSYGWNVTGVTTASRADDSERPRVFVQSVVVRSCLLGPVMLCGILIMGVIVRPPDLTVALSVMAGFVVVTGLAINWFYVGIGKPLLLVFYGAVPMLGAGLLTAVLVTRGWTPAVHGPAFILFGMASLIIGSVREAGASGATWRGELSLRAVAKYFSAHRSVAIAQVLTSSYWAIPMAFAAGLLPIREGAKYATTDRMVSVSNSVMISASNVLQAWTSEANAGRRAMRASVATVGVGVIGGVTFGLVGEFLTGLLFGRQVNLTEIAAWGVGLYIIAASVRLSANRYYLVPAQRYRPPLVSALTAVSVLSGLLAFSPLNSSASDVVIAFAVAEVCAATVEGWFAWARRANLESED